MQMHAIRKALAHNGISLDYTAAARRWIAHAGYDAMYGARPVKRVIQREVVGELSKRILAGAVSREKPIVIDAVDGALKVTN
jgi:ATP-dependent Clp protease ATP-binding subunit ClpB